VFPAVWGSLFGLAFLVAINPVLLAIILLMISRPRPVQNLLAYWVGGLTVNLVFLLIPLIVLHLTPTFASFAQNITGTSTAPSSTVRHIELGSGVLALSIAALMTLRSRARQRTRVPTHDDDASVLVLDSDKPSPISPLGISADAATQGGSPIRRLLGRLQKAWDDGSLWVSVVFGLLGLPPPLLVLFVDTTIVASGTSIGTQVGATIAFVLAMFAVVEITLISHLATPAKTQAVLRPVHDWALARRRQVMIAVFAVIGFFQVIKGLGIA
jgi:hypothetical protein